MAKYVEFRCPNCSGDITFDLPYLMGTMGQYFGSCEDCDEDFYSIELIETTRRNDD